MAFTNFAKLTDEQLTAWSRKFWRHMRVREFMSKFTGDDESAMIQRVTELKKDQKGARAVLTLVADAKGDGVAGDRQLEGNEEELTSQDKVIQIDMLRHAHRHEGEMADQRSVVTFRREAMSNLSFWLGDRRSQMALLALSGISFSFHTDGTARVGSQLPLLDFAADVKAPTAHRYFRADAANGLMRNDANTNLVVGDKITWGTVVDLRAQARYYRMKPIRTNDGVDFFHLFVHPLVFATLKKDPDYLANLRNAGSRGGSNDLFKGTNTIWIDGIAITEYDHVFTTKMAASGSKWGDGTIDGSRCILAGAQALGFADIGRPKWVEKYFDYDNQPGVSVGKIFGLLKPQFTDPMTNTLEDFGVMCLDVAI